MITLAKLEEALGPADEPLFFGEEGEWLDLSKKGPLGNVTASVGCANLEIDTLAYSSRLEVYRFDGPHPKESLDGYVFNEYYDLVEEIQLTTEQIEHAEKHHFENRALIAFYSLLAAYIDCFYGLCVDSNEHMSDEENVKWVTYFLNVLDPLSKEDCECGELAGKKVVELQEVAESIGLVL